MRFPALFLLYLRTLSMFVASGKLNATIGVLFDGENSDVEKAFKIRLDYLNKKSLNLIVNMLVISRKHLDYFSLSQKLCDAMNQGIHGIFNYGDPETYRASNAISEAFEIPYYNWNNQVPFGVKSRNFELNVKPQTSEVIADIIGKNQWTNVDYLYDTDEGLIKVQRITGAVLSKWSNAFEISPKQIDTRNLDFFFTEFHKSKKLGVHKVIIDVTKTNLLNRIMEILVGKSLNTRNIHYLLANPELNQKQLNQFDNGFMNITGIHQFNRETIPELKYFLQDWNGLNGVPEMLPEVAFACDSLSLFFHSLELLLNRTEFRKTFFPPDGAIKLTQENPVLCSVNQKETKVLPMGKIITRTSKKLMFTDALSGNVELDDNGVRRKFSLEVLELTFTAHWDTMAVSSESISEWRDGDGFLSRESRISYQRRVHGPLFLDRPRIITTVLNPPFLMQKEGGNFTGNDRYEGYCVDLMELLFKKVLQITYEIQIVKDSKYGNVNSRGEWNGMVGELLTGEADAAVAPLVITKARQGVVAFSKPFMTLGITIMIKKPDDKPDINVFAFMSPLSTEIWMYIIFAYVCVSIVIFLVSRFNAYEWLVEEAEENGFTVTNDFNIWNCLWFTLAAFMQQGIDILPRSIAGRIASSAWWFFTMIIVSSYTANLAAFCTLEKMQSPIESVEDLAKQTKIKYGIQGGGATAEFFKESTVQTYQRMWQFMSAQNPPVMVSSYAEGIQRVRESKGRYAFLLESTANNYANTRKPCDTMKVGTELNSVGYGVATPFDSDLRDRINLAILELQEKGELKKLENKWWYDRGQCDTGPQDAGSGELNLGKVAGVFYILIMGMVLGVIAAFLEFLYKARLEARKIEENRVLSEDEKDEDELKHGEDFEHCTTIV